ncbi:sugar transporter [Burkholderia multivorans]|uniref:sugar transporter n=1 Tax=Burkholderia multivorans TaxID=87883 RepID=UPI000D35FA22|nr:sugar transporter [Burkholderia multivorans]MBR8019652.1 sugar transporter [Burkholderia multivorans]MEB2508115.1 sugar transporter [Burkholderia multivorans]MEB2523084.1 sugar transporter [Burkholderia multivorans]MEB2574803.1 sugar transporter [Burkholderia multivorans]MEB2594939.1 sugar transporter [Burkholderia multivorans]
MPTGYFSVAQITNPENNRQLPCFKPDTPGEHAPAAGARGATRDSTGKRAAAPIRIVSISRDVRRLSVMKFLLKTIFRAD